MQSIVTTDFQYRPYWWEAAAPTEPKPARLEASYDVVIVGSGFTGVSAALHLARAGRSVAVLDKQLPGAGASRRNAGFVGRVLKKSFSEIAQAKGKEVAAAIYGELHGAYRFMFDLIEREGIACFPARPGRFIGATSDGHLAAMKRDLAIMRDAMGFNFEAIPRERQRDEMATDLYHGGVVIPDSACIHPGLYHKGLLELAETAGVAVFAPVEVLAIEQRAAAQCEVLTSAGPVRARDVVVGTNGYTSRLNWYRRRLVPFRAYMAATEEIPEDLFARLIPHKRTIIDSNTNIDFFRVAPDARRILFGGATASRLNGPEEIARRMKSILDRVMPEAAGIRLSHVWDGYCAGTFDTMPHVGSRGNIHHGVGYNFAGISMGSQFGDKISRRILNQPGGDSAFATDLPTMPFYRGTPWFLGLVMRYFDWQDRRLARNGAAS